MNKNAFQIKLDCTLATPLTPKQFREIFAAGLAKQSAIVYTTNATPTQELKMNLAKFAEDNRVTITSSPAPLCESDPPNSFRYVVKIQYAGKVVHVDYWKGAAHVGRLHNGKWKMLSYKELKLNNLRNNCKPIPPQLDEVLECIQCDCCLIDNYPFWEDFAENLGYNVDSIKDKKSFDATIDNYFKMKKLFGNKFSEFIACETETSLTT